jgi:hypothetical protein
MKKTKPFHLDCIVSKNMGSNQAEVDGSINFDTPILAIRVSCAHKCIIIGNRCNVGIKPN